MTDAKTNITKGGDNERYEMFVLWARIKNNRYYT